MKEKDCLTKKQLLHTRFQLCAQQKKADQLIKEQSVFCILDACYNHVKEFATQFGTASKLT